MATAEETKRQIVQSNFNMKRRLFGEDVCDVVSVTYGNDGSGQAVPAESTLAADVPCFYKAKADSLSRVVGGETILLTHDLELNPPSPLAMKPEYEVHIKPRGDKPALVFKHLIPRVASFMPLLKLEGSVQI